MPKKKHAKKAHSKPKKPVKEVKVEKPTKVVLPTVNKIPDDKAYEMIRNAKIPVAKHVFVKSEKDIHDAVKKTGFPCVMKVAGAHIIHKTELGGIKTNIHNEQEAVAAFKQLMKIKGCDKVLVQEQLTGVELIVGAKSDPQFGHVVSVGIGGIYVEIFKDVTFRVVPVGEKEAEAMIKELKGYEILAGARAQHPVKMDALIETLVKVGKFAVVNKIKELDLNPIFANQNGCFVADVRIIK